MKKSILLIDTETAKFYDDVYDIGYVITDKKGRISLKRNWLVEEIFTNPKKMMGAFYAGKHFSHYARMLQNDEIRLTPWDEIIEILRQDCIDYRVNIVSAYNLNYDIISLQNTHKGLNGIGNRILPYPMDLLCVWQFAKQTKFSQKTYELVARQESWKSKSGKSIGTKAEHGYRYVSGDWNFIEDHTALSDCLIENEILRSCFATKKRIPYNEIEDKYRPEMTLAAA